MVESTSEHEPTTGAQPTEGMVTPPQVEAAIPEDGSEVMTSAVQKKKNHRGLIALILLVIIGVGAYFLVSHKGNAISLDKIQGTVALSEQELRDVISANHLTVYWAGPMAGAKYTLLATNPAQIYIRYLPGGVGATDKSPQYRIVGTYVKKSAFAVGQYTGTLAGNVGMVNPDGNSVFYSSVRETNVYVGIKGKDIQIEVFDPVAGDALGLVLNKNQIVPVS